MKRWIWYFAAALILLALGAAVMFIYLVSAMRWMG